MIDWQHIQKSENFNPRVAVSNIENHSEKDLGKGKSTLGVGVFLQKRTMPRS